MGYRPLAEREIFRSDAWSEEHCVYICVGNEHCRALTYSGDLCVGYRSATHSGDPLEGNIALQMACKYSATKIYRIKKGKKNIVWTSGPILYIYKTMG